MRVELEKEKLVKRLREVCDFILQFQREDGQIELEEAHFIYPAGYNMRALAAAYKITGDEKYLEGVLKWTDLVFSQQNKDGSFWASTTQLENAYGRFVSDTANGLNVVYNILPYLDKERREKYLSGLEKFVHWIIEGEEGRSFILDNGACSCGIYKDDKKREDLNVLNVLLLLFQPSLYLIIELMGICNCCKLLPEQLNISYPNRKIMEFILIFPKG